MILDEMRVRNVSGKAQKVLLFQKQLVHILFKKKVPEGKPVICRRDFTKGQPLK